MKLFFRSFLTGLLLSLGTVYGQSGTLQKQSANEQLVEGQQQTGPVLNHIAVYVHDLKKSADFYEDVVQLRKIPEPFQDGRHEWFSIGGSQLHLIAGASAGREQNKNSHLCFSVQSIEAFIERLDEYGIDYSNWPGDSRSPTVRPDGVKQIYFQDPDGYWIEVNNDR